MRTISFFLIPYFPSSFAHNKCKPKLAAKFVYLANRRCFYSTLMSLTLVPGHRKVKYFSQRVKLQKPFDRVQLTMKHPANQLTSREESHSQKLFFHSYSTNAQYFIEPESSSPRSQQPVFPCPMSGHSQFTPFHPIDLRSISPILLWQRASSTLSTYQQLITLITIVKTNTVLRKKNSLIHFPQNLQYK